MGMLNAVAHQSSMQELDLLNPQLDPRISYSGGPKTYFGADGLMRESRGNFITYSEDFTNAIWSRSTGVSVTANAAVAPDGSMTADAVTYTGAGVAGSFRIWTNILTSAPNGLKACSSVWLRSDTPITLRVSSNQNNKTYDVTTDWQRFDCSFSGNGSINWQLAIYSATGDNTPFTIHVWGAQGEKGSYSPSYYMPTSGAVVYEWPLEYDPITLKPIGRSVWEQRTNLLQDSNQFDTTFWNKANLSVTTAAGVALDGTMTARLVSHLAGTSFPQIYSNNVSAAAGTRYTISLDITPVTAAGICALRAYRDGSNFVAVKLDFTGATPAAVLDTEAGVTGSTFTIERSGANRWRVTLSFTPTVSNGWGLRFYTGYASVSPAASYLIEAAQFEAGSFASQRIINTGTQVTRVADEVTFILAGIRFNALGMTLTAQAISGAVMPADQAAVQIDNGSSANRWILYRKTTGSALAAAARSSAGSAGDLNLAPAAPEGVAYRVAASFGDSNLRAVRDGGSIVQDVTTALPVGMTTGRVGKAAGASNYHNAPVQRLRFFPGQLADSELQALTA